MTMAVQELGVSIDEFWMMTYGELKMRLKGARQRLRIQCGFAAVICQHIAAYSAAQAKGGNRIPSVKTIVDNMMGKED